MTLSSVTPRRALALAAALLFLAGACGRDGGGGSASSSAPDSASQAAAEQGAIGVRVERVGERELAVSGRSTAARSVQVSVEDGESVLFGPAGVEVKEGRFRLDFAHEPTTRPRVFVYVSDPAGLSQTVVALDRASPAATGGPAPAPGEVPAPAGPRMGDRRTAVTERGLESPRLRVDWPRVRPGDRQVVVEGQARSPRVVVSVMRGDQVVGSESVAASGGAEGWGRFRARVPVPEGFREADAVVVAAGTGDADRELVFQPARS